MVGLNFLLVNYLDFYLGFINELFFFSLFFFFRLQEYSGDARTGASFDDAKFISINGQLKEQSKKVLVNEDGEVVHLNKVFHFSFITSN